MCDRAHRFRGLRGFAGDNPKIKLRQFHRIVRCAEIRMKFVGPQNVQAVLIERFRMLRPANKRPYFSNFGQVRGIQASDRTTPDDADSFDQIVQARKRLCAGARMFDANHRSKSA